MSRGWRAPLVITRFLLSCPPVVIQPVSTVPGAMAATLDRGVVLQKSVEAIKVDG